ncbi:hypothetical protein BUALT_Bualt08G0005900 [Buddleja alternifolia]|uniref:PMI1/PMIR1-2 C-terminal domain-containing protein n=1 Tax=Buddleja alternifolia TaxID=168488 RepID=A0AAV6XB74_9LAMI|nr:hypothetical protein BUALT_Bualt08G0005900 [Buddleja alternifolia]
MAADYTGRRNSNTQILQELETLSETLYQSHTSNRRTASLALPRTAIPPIPSADEIDTEKDGLPGLNPKPRSRRICYGSITSIFHERASVSVCVRKKESKDGVVQTMPSRVSQGAADFEETLFISVCVAVDAEELDFGRSVVDLSGLIQESIDKSFEGARIRQWDSTFNLSGKAKGGELVLKLGFQIMEKDGGIGIYSQAEGQKGKKYSPSIARKQSKSSFSVPSPRMSSRAEAWTPSQKLASSEFQEMDDLNLDEPAPPVASVSQKSEEITETKMDDGDLLDFDVVDKGVEKIEDKKDEDEEEDEERSEEYSTDKRSVSSEIKVLESMMGEEKRVQKDEETASQTLDADEDKVTREFLQMLESDGEDDSKLKINYNSEIPPLKLGNEEDVGLEEEFEGFISDLGKGLGSVVQTRNGGYLAAMNPLDNVVARKDTPKLAMQMSKPIIIQSKESGFELFQKMAAIGIASAIIQGRNKEGASSTAARTIATVKSMANAMSSGRKERVSTGIWNVSENPLTVDEILAFSMQKIENMAIEALKIEADMAEEDAPCSNRRLDKDECRLGMVTISVIVQLRDPVRQYEAVGGPLIALIHATDEEFDSYNEEKRYKVASLQVGGVKVKSLGSKNAWDGDKQRLTALQWLVAHGLGKARKKGKRVVSKGPDLLWSISSRVMADMWLKPIRNPDVKFTK